MLKVLKYNMTVGFKKIELKTCTLSAPLEMLLGSHQLIFSKERNVKNTLKDTLYNLLKITKSCRTDFLF